MMDRSRVGIQNDTEARERNKKTLDTFNSSDKTRTRSWTKFLDCVKYGFHELESTR